MTLANPTIAKTGQLVLTTEMDSNVFAHPVTPVHSVTKTSLTVKKIPVRLVPHAST